MQNLLLLPSSPHPKCALVGKNNRTFEKKKVFQKTFLRNINVKIQFLTPVS